MNLTIELPNDIASVVETTAGAEGLSPSEWISKEIVARIAAQVDEKPTSRAAKKKTLADLLPHIGMFEGKPGTENLSEHGRDAFIQHLVEQHESYGRNSN